MSLLILVSIISYINYFIYKSLKIYYSEYRERIVK